jgi:SSS family solute:Na+ symporter
MGIIFAGFINRLRPLVTCFLGLIVFHWIHEMHMAEPLTNKDLTFSFAMREMAPTWGLRGIVLAGFMAAVMSTLGALSNSTATIFSMDVYKKIINKDASDANMVWVGRTAAFSALILAAVTCPIVGQLGGIFQYFQKGVTFLATPFISVMLMGIFWQRTNRQGALFGMVAGVIMAMGIGFGAPVIGITMHWLYIGFFVQIITMVGIAVVSLMTAAPASEQSLPFRWRVSMLTGYDDGVKRPWYKSLLLWFCLLYLVTGITYWYFW